MEPKDLIKSQNNGTQLPDGQLVWIPPGYQVVTEDAKTKPESHLWDHIWLIWRRRWLVLLIFIICLSTTVLLTLKATPIYEASAKLRIEREASKLVPFQNENSDYLYDNGKTDFIETQRQIVLSREIAKEVVKTLNFKPEVDEDQVTNPTVIGRMIRSLKGRIQAVTKYLGSFGGGGEKASQPAIDPQTLEMQLRIDALAADLTVTQLKNTEIVEVSYASKNPKQCPAVANAICDAYVHWTFLSKFNSYEYARDWLKSKLDEVKAKLEESEQQLNKMSVSKDFIALTDKTDPLSQQIETTRQKLNDAEHTLFEKTFALKRFENDPGFTALQSLGDLRLQALLQAYRDVEVQLDKASAELGPATGAVKQLTAAKRRFETQLKEEQAKALKSARFDCRQAEADRDFLKQNYEKERSRIVGIQQGYIQYNILKREVDINRDLYDSLLQRWKEVGVTSGLKPSNVTVVEAAIQPLLPKYPNKLRNLALGSFLGLFLGIGLAFFLEYMDTSVKDGEELERLTHMITLGVIPHFDPKRLGDKSRVKVELASQLRPKSSFAESIRTLRTSLQYSMPGKAPKTILVTSCFPGEGKSTVAINLAISLAQLNKSVLLIDADLKKPSLHKFFDANRSHGLTDILTGKFDGDSIEETEIPNLFLLPSGAKPPNPADLLDSQVMRRFLEKAAIEYDQIIIDSAPSMQLADTVVLAPYVDGLILVVQPGKTPREAVRSVKEKLVEVQGRMLGAVLNNPRHMMNTPYGRGYGYGYGYGYGNGKTYGADDNHRKKNDEEVIDVIPMETDVVIHSGEQRTGDNERPS